MSAEDLGSYSPADFLDASEMRPVGVLLDPTGTGTNTPYMQLVSNIMSRNMYEIRNNVDTPQVSAANIRKRIREFMVGKNEVLVANLRKPVAQHPVLGKADAFIHRFGRMNFNPSHDSLRDVALDISGEDCLPKIEVSLKNFGPASIKELGEQTRHLYELYCEAGEELYQNENALKLKLDIFDKVYQKITSFLELPTNETTEELAAAIEKYLTKAFDENKIEEAYTKAVKSYRHFITLHECIQFHRFIDLVDKEPLCSICLTETVTHTLSPCGHTFCGNCIKRQVSSCSYCRSSIRERIRIYFG